MDITNQIWSQAMNEIVEKANSGKIAYIKNLPLKSNSEELYDLFG